MRGAARKESEGQALTWQLKDESALDPEGRERGAFRAPWGSDGGTLRRARESEAAGTEDAGRSQGMGDWPHEMRDALGINYTLGLDIWIK